MATIAPTIGRLTISGSIDNNNDSIDTSTEPISAAVAITELTNKGPIDFNLYKALNSISADNPNNKLTTVLTKAENDLLNSRSLIVSNSRLNFILERELNELDEKIKLLIKNKIALQEVLSNSTTVHNNNNSSDDNTITTTVLKGRRLLYEELFYLLQHSPIYLAELSRLLMPKEIPLFVQTVIFDLFGDQYNSREERLLLALFHRVLQSELEYCTDKGSLLRNNTAITQMLSAYARRGQGLSVLKGILEKPIKSLLTNKDLNLEINPSKVYLQLISDYETETGKVSPLNKQITDNEAAEHPETRAVIQSRSVELLAICSDILDRIESGVSDIPYGMRWICKTLSTLFKAKFPDADRYQRGSLIGGYIYLRFFNPVIVTPDTVNFISIKPNRIQRRNLILIAKVLQNLSNGILFGDKEFYMKSLNPFITSRLAGLQAYFDELIAVEDSLQDKLQLDQYLEHTINNETGRFNKITISIKQILLIQYSLNKHLTTVIESASKGINNSNNNSNITNNTNEDLKQLLSQLGPIPTPNNDWDIKNSENQTTTLNLIDRRKHRITTVAVAAAVNNPAMNNNNPSSAKIGSYSDYTPSSTTTTTATLHPMQSQARQLLLSLLYQLPVPNATDCLILLNNSFLQYLEYQLKLCKSAGNKQLSDVINNTLSMLNTLYSLQLFPNNGNNNLNLSDSINSFLWTIATDSIIRLELLNKFQNQLILINTGLQSIQTHHQYLQSRLELYRIYLNNARQGQAQATATTTAASSSANNNSKSKDSKSTSTITPKNSSTNTASSTAAAAAAGPMIVRFPHSQLLDQGVVTFISPTVGATEKSVLKSSQYIFTETSPGCYSVDLVVKKVGIELHLIQKPIELILDDLLRLQESGQLELDLELIKLNINLLIHLINHHFILKKGKK